MFIGTLDELLYKGEFALKTKVHELDWSTTSLSEQKLEIGKAGVKMKDSNIEGGVKTDEPRIKEENKEMKEFGTREPDLMIKGEDTKDVEMKDMTFRPVPSKEVPDAVQDVVQGL